MADIRSRARIPQKRVQVGAPVFQPAGAEEQRLFTEGEPVPKTTDDDIQKRLAGQDLKTADDNAERFKRIQDMYAPQVSPEVEALDKSIEGTPTAVEGEKPPGTFEPVASDTKAKLEKEMMEGTISPEEVQEIIKRLGR
jgi:hypothetical protein